eukprot:1778518-Pleurochrysis_carterae.AAC.1
MGGAALLDARSLPPPARRSGPGGPRSPIALCVSAAAALADATLAQQLRPTSGGRHTPHTPRARAARRTHSLCLDGCGKGSPARAAPWPRGL